MADLNEVIVEWNVVNSNPGLSVLYFDATVAIADTRLNLGAALNDLEPVLANSTTYSIRTEGRTIDDATGNLTGAWGSTVGYTGNGTGGVQPVANASMMLLRSNTTLIVNNRFLRGRTFIPGVAIGFLQSGEFSEATQEFVTDIFDLGFAESTGHRIWHRPLNGPGSSADVTSYSVWKEAAVMRRRR